jgi:predicted O-methyltransferase YrrM
MKEFDMKHIEHINKKGSICLSQIKAVYDYASRVEGNVVEIGSYIGRSTVVIAAGLAVGNKGKVFAIDPHASRFSDYELFLDNIESTSFADYIIPIKSTSERVLEKKSIKRIFKHPIGLVFIDGDHRYEPTKKDTRWIKLVEKGGFIIFHDYKRKDERHQGVTQAVDEYLENNNDAKKVKKVFDLLILEKL